MSEQPIEPCPFCGGECRIVNLVPSSGLIHCDSCGYYSSDRLKLKGAISAHNRVSLASRAAPDLVESINRLLGWVEQESIPGGWRADDVAFARAAIAKATGNG